MSPIFERIQLVILTCSKIAIILFGTQKKIFVEKLFLSHWYLTSTFTYRGILNKGVTWIQM